MSKSFSFGGRPLAIGLLSPPARANPSSGACHAAFRRAVSGVLLLTLAAMLAGCEFDTSVGWDKQSGTNRTERVKAEMKLDGGL